MSILSVKNLEKKFGDLTVLNVRTHSTGKCSETYGALS